MIKKLLFCNDTLGGGGIERSLCDILRHLDYSKYEVDLYLNSTNGIFIDQLPCQVHIINPNMDGCYGPFSQVARHLMHNRDFSRLWLRIVHLIKIRFGYPAYWLSRPSFRKNGPYDVVVSFKEGDIAQFARRSFRYRKIVSWWHCASEKVDPSEFVDYERFDNVIAVSPSAQSVLHNLLPETVSISRVISNMVDVFRIREMADCDNQEYQKGKIHIVTVSRLSPEKHLLDIIPCAQELLRNGMDIQWHIVGEGLEKQLLNERIIEAHLEKVIILEGEQSNPYSYIGRAHLYVHTSYIESQGLTILEAMSLGVPCVVTKSLGPCEFIKDGVNALLCEQDPNSLSKKVLEILTNHELYEHIKSNTHCPEQFLPERVMEQIDTLLEAIT